MEPDELLDYALGRLDPLRRERLERRMARDPELAERVASLTRNLARLLDDGREGGPSELPPDPGPSPLARLRRDPRHRHPEDNSILGKPS